MITSSPCKITKDELAIKSKYWVLPKSDNTDNCGYQKNNHWCQFCLIKSLISGMITIQSQAYTQQCRDKALEALALLINAAQLNNDSKIQPHTQKLHELVSAWNLKVYKRFRLNIQPHTPFFNDMIDWHMSHWPDSVDLLIHKITTFAKHREGAKETNKNSYRNQELALKKARTRWMREKREGRAITRVTPMSKKLARTSQTWTIDGKPISIKAIKKLLKESESTPAEALRVSRPPKKPPQR